MNMSGSSKLSSERKENAGKDILVLPLVVVTPWPGSLENAFVASREDDSVGTYRQLGIVIILPLEAVADIVPVPWIGVVVTPSARVTTLVPSHGE